MAKDYCTTKILTSKNIHGLNTRVSQTVNILLHWMSVASATVQA